MLTDFGHGRERRIEQSWWGITQHWRPHRAERLAQFRDETVSNAGADAGFECGDAWSPVATKRIAHDGQPLGIDFSSLHQVVDHRLDWHLVVMPEGKSWVEIQRAPLARSLEGQTVPSTRGGSETNPVQALLHHPV